ncbi:hypothetical protein GBFDFA_15625 [Edwardsiella anguillarum]|nr:hypothetical protein PBOPBF_14940 [Edwardsiella anguillarum]BET85547.1 hypothetical protein GHNJMD_15955 [Edwardsiella anguillarum]BET88910.1 hypothetical protein GBFDFA_15625 [Edwardsiella anguillarum]BET92201.1 hypothetical protein BIKEJJ_14950 [Edwardsiella anguillarum]
MQSIILWNQQSISNTDGGELYQVLLSLIHKAEEIEQMVQKSEEITESESKAEVWTPLV